MTLLSPSTPRTQGTTTDPRTSQPPLFRSSFRSSVQSRSNNPLASSIRSTTTNASIKSTNSFSCERQVLHPLDPEAEPEALFYYQSSEDEDDADYSDDGYGDLIGTPPMIKSYRKNNGKGREELELKSPTQEESHTPLSSPVVNRTSRHAPILPSPLRKENVRPQDVNAESPLARRRTELRPETIAETLESSEDLPLTPRRGSAIAEPEENELMRRFLNDDWTVDFSASTMSPPGSGTPHITPRRSKNEQYIGQYLVSSPSPNARRTSQLLSPPSKDASEIQSALYKLRRSVDFQKDREAEQEQAERKWKTEQIAEKSKVNPILLEDRQFRETVQYILDSKMREEQARLEEYRRAEAAKQEEERRRAEAEAARIREAQEAERRKREAEEAERKAKQQAIQAAKEREEAAKREADAQAAKQAADAQAAAKKASDDAAAAEAAALKAQEPPPIVPLIAEDPARIQLDLRAAQMHTLLMNLKKVRQYVKGNAELRKRLNVHRRAIKPKLGQFNGETKQTGIIRDALVNILNKAKDEPGDQIRAADYQILPAGTSSTEDLVPLPFIWLVNEMGKMVIEQFEAEVAVNPKVAGPIGICLTSTLSRPAMMANGVSFLDILVARIWKRNMIVRGEIGPDATDADLKRLGYLKTEEGKWEGKEEFSTRLGGLSAGYAAIASRNFTKASMSNPHPMHNLWFLYAHYLNTPAAKLTNSHYFAIKTMLETSMKTFVTLYAQQGVKMIDAIVGPFADEGVKLGRNGAASLKALGDVLKKEGLD
ncbi:GLE1-domain-containing protein [Ascobolus immersus RN42]|uniref:mRNA export factor GLE1 n=1 Tax=Ascobolus immersus RN42 TaxID=1160509 RepID=A0A3N4HJ34_ASCIM|nr:GLE1-domain-containing protein [Ascobolus immersus RN42]